MRRLKKVISIILIISMAISVSMPVFALDASSKKEEVIYVMTNADGSIDGTYAVNIFDKGDIIDYGNYSSIKMLNTNDIITQDGDKITFSTTQEKVYYQGTLDDVQIPWDISISYFLDGDRYLASELAGKSGNLEIQLKLTKNNKCSDYFYDEYALQATFELDTNNCSNIQAPEATVANVGGKKQLTYTILPGRGIDTKITADVNDFEMNSISINGIKLNLNLDLNDTELMQKVDELVNGIAIIDDSATSIQDGVLKLKDGSYSLSDGISSLTDGINKMDDGLNELQVGIANTKNGVDLLNSKSELLVGGSADIKEALLNIQSALSPIAIATDKFAELTGASGQIKEGINNLYISITELQKNLEYAQYKDIMKNNGLNIDGLVEKNAQTIVALTKQIEELNNALNTIKNVSEYEKQAKELKNQINQLEDTIALLNGNNALVYGTQSYLDGLYKAVGNLYEGAATLTEKYNDFDLAITQLATSLSDSIISMSNLAGTINKLVDKYSELDNGMAEYTNGVAFIAAGYNQMIDGVTNLTAGSMNLREGSINLYDKSLEYSDGMIFLYDRYNKLAEGISTLRDNTSNINNQIEDTMNQVLGSANEKNSKVVSFVSNKNLDVESVQFVIKTSAIKKADESIYEEKTVELLSLWQKILRLFGLY